MMDDKQLDKLLHYVKEAREWLEVFEIVIEKSKESEPRTEQREPMSERSE